jgi:hypothetical protein
MCLGLLFVGLLFGCHELSLAHGRGKSVLRV